MSADAATGDDDSGGKTLFVKLIHQSLRVDGARLVASVAALDVGQRQNGRLGAVRAFFEQYRCQLLLHHSHEDNLFFPAMEARVGADRMRLDELTHQHERIDPALQAASDLLLALADPDGDFQLGRTAASDALDALNQSLATHLDLEEATVLPLWESEIPLAETKQLETLARRATPRAQTQFLIPWIVAHATSNQRRALFRSAPPLRIVNLIVGPRYRRFERALVDGA